MMKTIQTGILMFALVACAARPAMRVTPEQRARAATVVLRGGTVRDVAADLAMSEDDARRLVRSTIRELMRGLRGDHTRHSRAE